MLRKVIMIYLYIHFGFLVPSSCTEASEQQLELQQKEKFIQYGDIQQIIQMQDYTLQNRSDATKKHRRVFGNEYHLTLPQKIRNKRYPGQKQRDAVIEQAIVKQQLEEFLKIHGHLPQTIFVQNEERKPATHFVGIGDLFKSVVNSIEKDDFSERTNTEDKQLKQQGMNDLDNNVQVKISGNQTNILEKMQPLQQYQYALPIQQQLIQLEQEQLKLPQNVNQQKTIENQKLVEQLLQMKNLMEQNQIEGQVHMQKLTETQVEQKHELGQWALKVVNRLEKLLEGQQLQQNQGWNSNQQNPWFPQPRVPQNIYPPPNQPPSMMPQSNVNTMVPFWYQQNPTTNLYSSNLNHANLNPTNLNHANLNLINLNHAKLNPNPTHLNHANLNPNPTHLNHANLNTAILSATNLNPQIMAETPKMMSGNPSVWTVVGYISTAIATIQAYVQLEAWEQVYRTNVVIEDSERHLAQISSKVGLIFADADHIGFLKDRYEESHFYFRGRGRVIAQIKNKISRMAFLLFQTGNILTEVKIALTSSREGIAVYQRQQPTNSLINIILFVLNTVQLFTDGLSLSRGAITGAFVALPVGNAAFCFLVKKYVIIFRDIIHGIIELELQLEAMSVHLHDTEDWLEFIIEEYGEHIGYHGVYKPTNVNLSNNIPLNASFNYGGFNFSPFSGSGNPVSRPGNPPAMMPAKPPAMMMGSSPAMMMGSSPAMMMGSSPAMMMGSSPAMMMNSAPAQTNRPATIIVL